MKNNVYKNMVEIEYAVDLFLKRINKDRMGFKVNFLGNKRYHNTFKPENAYEVTFNHPISLNSKVISKIKVRYCKSIHQAKTINFFLDNKKIKKLEQPTILGSYNNILLTEWVDGDSYNRQEKDYLKKIKKIGILHGLIEDAAISSEDIGIDYIKDRFKANLEHLTQVCKYFFIDNYYNEFITVLIEIFNKEISNHGNPNIVLSAYDWKRQDVIFSKDNIPKLIDIENIDYGIEGYSIWKTERNAVYFYNNEEKDYYLKGIKDVLNNYSYYANIYEYLFNTIYMAEQGYLIFNYIKTAEILDEKAEWKFVYKELNLLLGEITKLKERYSLRTNRII
ncbi:hypothetical protein [Bacillus wiedmannii]|uniref:hypothetical protein n=1 Tax=Bacillus wiedmannii TaxID=1890302 RepID=UPI000BF0FCA4|nr:hypothetical protein [Bacillus wiedmannii]PEM16047.1 hypothetical protein CN617_31885 [Bacillus wiedmannii]